MCGLDVLAAFMTAAWQFSLDRCQNDCQKPAGEPTVVMGDSSKNKTIVFDSLERSNRTATALISVVNVQSYLVIIGTVLRA